MIRLRHKLFIQGLRLFDQAALALSLFITVAIAKGVQSWPQVYIVFQREYKLIESLALIAILAGWYVIYNRFVQYNTNQFIPLLKQLWVHVKASTTTAFLVLLISVLFEFETLNLKSIALFWALNIGLGSSFRLFLRFALVITAFSESSRRNIVIVGTGKEAKAISKAILKRKELGYQIRGFISVDSEGTDLDETKVIGSLTDLPRILEKEKVDEIVIAVNLEESLANVMRFKSLANAIVYGKDLGLVVRLFPGDSLGSIIDNLGVETFENQQVVTLFRERHVLQLLVKRVIDVVVSGIMLILLSPLFIILAIAIKLDSPGPILFAQERVGMNKRKFKLLKFRSMVVNAED